MVCVQCQSAFEMAGIGPKLRLTQLPPFLPPGLAGHWLTPEEIGVAVRRAAARHSASQPIPSQPRSELTEAASQVPSQPFIQLSAEKAEAQSISQPTSAGKATPSKPRPAQAESQEDTSAASAAHSQPLRSGSNRVSSNPFYLSVTEADFEAGVPPEVLQRAQRMLDSGSTSEQIQIALEKSHRFTQPQIQLVMQEVRGLVERHNRRQRQLVWLAIGVVAVLAFLCLAFVLYPRLFPF